MSDNGAFLERAIADGHAEFSGEGSKERIHYIAARHSERWSDPEEKVRAELWAELIYKYEYPPERMRFEVTVPDRTPERYADIVIYRDDELKSPYFVFECKRADISDEEFDQAIEQAVGNRNLLGAAYCGAVAGLTHRFLRFDKFPPGERDRNRMAGIPVLYDAPPEWGFYKNVQGHDLAAVSREELRAAIRKCHQTLWEGGRRSSIEAFGEFSKIVFIKHRDEKDLDRPDGDPYAFQSRAGETDGELAMRISRLYEAEQALEPDVFTESISIDPPILAKCVEHLEGISLDRTELDTKGVAFEEFMGGFFKGDFGQYFTPRELISFAVAMLDPQRNDFVLDPACGSGGFLLYALDHVRRQANRMYDQDSVQNFRYWHDFAQSNLFGIEINESLARVAKMNMIIHDDGHTNIVGNDALDFPLLIQGKNQNVAFGKFDLVLTNPPFGAVIRRTEKGDGYLEQFELMGYLGKNWPLRAEMDGMEVPAGAKSGSKAVKPRASIKTEIAFVERIHSFLKPGTGRAAVVLPDGILTNSSLQGVRHWIMNRFQVLAVVSLPQFAFAPYDAAVKSSIVFLRRLADEETPSDDEAIFMALAENIGYDATGHKAFTVSVEREEEGNTKVERHSCDLFDYRVFYEWTRTGAGEGEWSERRREVIPGTGIVGQWEEFQKDPTPFLGVKSAEFAKPECFAVRLGEGSDTRFDVDIHHPEHTDLASHIGELSHTALISEIIASPLMTGFAAGKAARAQPGDKAALQIRPTQIQADGEIEMSDAYGIRINDISDQDFLSDGEVLFNNTNSTELVGKSAVFREGGPAVCSNHITRLKIRQGIEPEFVALALNVLRLKGYFARICTNFNNQAGINTTTLEKVRIPLLPASERRVLLADMDAARADRKAKLAQAEALWREAKQQFEERLLGNAPS